MTDGPEQPLPIQIFWQLLAEQLFTKDTPGIKHQSKSRRAAGDRNVRGGILKLQASLNDGAAVRDQVSICVLLLFVFVCFLLIYISVR